MSYPPQYPGYNPYGPPQPAYGQGYQPFYQKKNSHKVIIAILIILVILGGVAFFYFHFTEQGKKKLPELEAEAKQRMDQLKDKVNTFEEDQGMSRTFEKKCDNSKGNNYGCNEPPINPSGQMQNGYCDKDIGCQDGCESAYCGSGGCECIQAK